MMCLAYLLRLNLLRLFGERSRQSSDALLERAVLGGVDERVDTAVGEHQHHGEVIEPTVNSVNVMAGR